MKKLFQKECAASFDEPIGIGYGKVRGIAPICENVEVPDDPSNALSPVLFCHHESLNTGICVSFYPEFAGDELKVELRGAKAARFLKGYGEYLAAQSEKKANLEKENKK